MYPPSHKRVFVDKLKIWSRGDSITIDVGSLVKSGKRKRFGNTVKNPYARTDVAVLIRKLKKQHGMTGVNLASEVERITGQPVHRNSINSWGRGEYLPSEQYDSILMPALRQIEAETRHFENSSSVQPEELSNFIKNWMRLLKATTLTEISLKLDVPMTTIVRWSSGKHSAERERIEEINQKVAAIAELEGAASEG